MLKGFFRTSIVALPVLLGGAMSAQAADIMTLYKCNAEVMAAAQAIITRRDGGSRDAAENAVLERPSDRYATNVRRSVAAIYAIDEEVFANSMGMGMIDDVKQDCMGE